jgi:hypothetical protein
MATSKYKRFDFNRDSCLSLQATTKPTLSFFSNMHPSTLLLALVVSATANPIHAGTVDVTSRDALLEDRATCQKIHSWSGGGCSLFWGNNKCRDKCIKEGPGQKCCPNAVVSAVEDRPGCLFHSKVCDCGCLRN